MYRNTYLEINMKNIKLNVETIINNCPNYKYYIGVVKADCYNHGIKAISSIIVGGCNYLAVATLDEALEIRDRFKDIPILCLGIIPINYLDICIKNDIAITISSLQYLEEINLSGLKVHLKINTGMNRLGISNRNELNIAYKKIMSSNLYLEGIYTHIYESSDRLKTNNQFDLFESITSDIDLSTIKIVHIGGSEAITNYNKKNYINGCRLGITMYGFSSNKNLKLFSTFRLISNVVQINSLDGTVGYDGIYKTNGIEKIAVVSIGYADGIIRKNSGGYVYINNKQYKIVGNVCMDMLFVKVDDTVKVGDKVMIINGIDDINEMSIYLETIPYEILCSITRNNKRLSRIYIK